MTTGQQLIDELNIDRRVLQDKKEQTTKKIEYIRAYVEKWLYVWTNRSVTKSVTFIDAMSNAGIYSDGDYGTSVEVCKLFTEHAKKHPNIEFRIYVNDYDAERI